MTKDNKQPDGKTNSLSSENVSEKRSDTQSVKTQQEQPQKSKSASEQKLTASSSNPNTGNKGNDVEKNQQQNKPETHRTSKVETKSSSASNRPEKNKKGGTGLALFALLIALGVGAGGYYLGQQQLANIEQKITALETNQSQVQPASQDEQAVSQVSTQLTELSLQYQTLNNKLAQLEQQQTNEQQYFAGLKEQVNKLNNVIKAEPNDWVLSEVDFLLNNALRKLVLDADVDTAIALLQVASQSLEQITDAQVVNVRRALNEDLKQLLAVNNIDQNAIMQRLSLLANKIDELEILNINFGNNDTNNAKLTDSIDDWQENVKKSAVSFLNHFIRITPRSADDKALLAPNQDIYLRENIRLRLQIAILAVPRQQNELYKQSLEAVAAWVRSYFNTNTESAKNFLQQVDNLMEQSIYVDVPTKLTSLTLLDQLLHRQGQEVQRIEIRVDKALSEDSEQQADKIIEDASQQQTEQIEQEVQAEAPEQDESTSADETEEANDTSSTSQTPVE